MITTLAKITSLIIIFGCLFFLLQKRDFSPPSSLNFLNKSTTHKKEANPILKEELTIQEETLPTVVQQPEAPQPTPATTSEIQKVQPEIPKVVTKNQIYEDLHEGVSDTDPSYRPLVSPCTEAMGFKIGVFDSRFGITKDFFIQEIIQSAAVWGDAVDKKLFYYDPNGSLTVNLIYDERQETTIIVNNLALEIENTKRNAEELHNAYEAEKKIYNRDYEQLAKDIENFQIQQKAYEEKVKTYNASGGATRIEYEAMTNELNQLKKDAQLLEERKLLVNTFVDTINKKVTRYNEFVRYTNGLIRKSNALGASKFTEGKFTPLTNTIDIYQYNDSIKLRRVLIHELGHVLGINHNKNVYSIMYSFNSATTTSLSKEDLASLKEVCPL